jgi:hypothetical protein
MSSNISLEHPDANEAVAQGFESEEHKTRHVVAVVFHFLFKVSAVLWYLFSGLLLQGFVLTFVVQVLLLAFDFWTVKNVTGRLLVGLRWWQELKPDGYVCSSFIYIYMSHSLYQWINSRIERVDIWKTLHFLSFWTN